MESVQNVIAMEQTICCHGTAVTDEVYTNNKYLCIFHFIYTFTGIAFRSINEAFIRAALHVERFENCDFNAFIRFITLEICNSFTFHINSCNG